jgi:hypothetical protein
LETDADAWVWPGGGAAMPPLPGYLWELANVRHEARSLAERRAQLRLEELYDRATQFEKAEHSHPQRAEERAATLRTLQREAALAAASEAPLRAMYRTAAAAADNARQRLRSWAQTVPGGVEGGPDWDNVTLTGPIADDRDYAAWLLIEIDDVATTIHDAVAYAEPMVRIGSAEIEQVLKELAERNEFRTVLQTAVIAAVGLALAAAQSLDLHWPLDAPLQTPIVATVASLGLFLTTVPALRRSAVPRLQLFAGLSGVGLVASLFWLGVTWATLWRTEHLPAPTLTLIVVGSASGLGVAAFLTWMVRSGRARR